MRGLFLATSGAALLTSMLAGCVVPTGPVEVTRFNRVAEGQSYGTGSYIIELADIKSEATPAGSGTDADSAKQSPPAENSSSLALSPYSAAVQREMQRIGYSRAGNGDAQYTVSIRVRVNERIIDGRSPVSVGVGGHTGGYRSSGVGVGLGVDLGGGRKERQLTRLSVRIRDNANNAIIWEGKAEQEAGKGTPAAQPGIAASKLAQALFTNFPGENGEIIKIP